MNGIYTVVQKKTLKAKATGKVFNIYVLLNAEGQEIEVGMDMYCKSVLVDGGQYFLEFKEFNGRSYIKKATNSGSTPPPAKKTASPQEAKQVGNAETKQVTTPGTTPLKSREEIMGEGQARGNYRTCLTSFIIAKNLAKTVIEFNTVLKEGEENYFSKVPVAVPVTVPVKTHTYTAPSNPLDEALPNE
jgi:hypothetical protein